VLSADALSVKRDDHNRGLLVPHFPHELGSSSTLLQIHTSEFNPLVFKPAARSSALLASIFFVYNHRKFWHEVSRIAQKNPPDFSSRGG
jgi:hypothetical protein